MTSTDAAKLLATSGVMSPPPQKKREVQELKPSKKAMEIRKEIASWMEENDLDPKSEIDVKKVEAMFRMGKLTLPHR